MFKLSKMTAVVPPPEENMIEETACDVDDVCEVREWGAADTEWISVASSAEPVKEITTKTFSGIGTSLTGTTTVSPGWATTTTGPLLPTYDEVAQERSVANTDSKQPRIIVEVDDETQQCVAFLSNSDLVQGRGRDALQAVEELYSSITALLSFAHSDPRPTLHPVLLEQVKSLHEFAKALGLNNY